MVIKMIYLGNVAPINSGRYPLVWLHVFICLLVINFLLIFSFLMSNRGKIAYFMRFSSFNGNELTNTNYQTSQLA